jgi:hypothetical protein
MSSCSPLARSVFGTFLQIPTSMQTQPLLSSRRLKSISTPLSGAAEAEGLAAGPRLASPVLTSYQFSDAGLGVLLRSAKGQPTGRSKCKLSHTHTHTHTHTQVSFQVCARRINSRNGDISTSDDNGHSCWRLPFQRCCHHYPVRRSSSRPPQTAILIF